MPVVPASSSTAAPTGAQRPSRSTLGWLTASVLALHLALLLGLTGALDWRLESANASRVAPLQTRWIPPLPDQAAPATKAAPATPRTRAKTLAEVKPVAKPAAPASGQAQEPAVRTEQSTAEETGLPPGPPPAEAALTSAPPASESTAAPAVAPATVSDAASDAATTPPAAANASLPPIPVGALPPPVLLSYRLTGQEKGLNYHANGELRWQHNEAAYALSLSVKAFLVGSRQWRSQGDITSTGLAPIRFSDSWRNERAAHFDRAQNRVVFSSNAPVAALEPGAQDQISLYVQLAAAMAGDPQRFQPGTRLQVQTATTRDALPWLLTLGPAETLLLDGQAVPTAKWVCQPRNRFDAKVEFWVSAQHAWMPVRIRISQVSGSFIDLLLTGKAPLPLLPVTPPDRGKTTPS
jgi:hypothetical protein